MTSSSHNDYYDTAFFATSHSPISTNAVWHDLHLIPSTAPTPAALPAGGTPDGPVRGISGVELTQNNAFPLEFSSTTPGQVTNVVLPYVGLEAYAPILTDSASTPIPYNPKIWYIDSVTGLVVFRRKTPVDLGYAAGPLTLTYWQYVGVFSGVGAATNTGGGTAIYTGMIGDVAQFRSVYATEATGISISTSTHSGAITFTNTMEGSNIGTAASNTDIQGSALSVAHFYSGKNASTGALEFRSLVAGNRCSLTTDGSGNVLLNVQDSAYSVVSAGGVNSLVALPNGDEVNIKGLTAGTGMTLSNDSTSVTITNNGVVSIVAADTESSGLSIINASVTGAATTLKNLAVVTTSGLSLANSGTSKDLVITNTMTGGNLGGGVTIFDSKVDNVLNFNSLAVGTGGLTITQSALITVDCTLEGKNNSAGTVALYTGKTQSTTGPVAATLNFLSLTQGSGILIASDANTATITSKAAIWVFWDQKATGTGGGTSTAGVWNDRLLNNALSTGYNTTDVALNTTTGVITIQPGTYYIDAICPMQASTSASTNHRVGFLTAANVVVLQGPVVQTATSRADVASMKGLLVVASTTTYTLSHYITQPRSNTGLGLSLGVHTDPEIYSQISITRVA